MAWGSDHARDNRLPADWKRRRLRVLKRDHYRCRVCGGVANQVDHIVAGDDHAEENLQSLCLRHHQEKTAREGHAAKARMRAAQKRPVRRHPGSRR